MPTQADQHRHKLEHAAQTLRNVAHRLEAIQATMDPSPLLEGPRSALNEAAAILADAADETVGRQPER